MAPVTIARFVQELEKLKQVSDAESSSRRIRQSTRPDSFKSYARRASTPIAPLPPRRSRTPSSAGSSHCRCRPPAAPAGAHLDALEVLLLPSDVEHLVAVPAAQRGQAFSEGHALSAVGADPVLGHAGKPGRFLGRGTTDQRCGGWLMISRPAAGRPRLRRRHRGVLRAARASSLGTTRHGGAGGRCRSQPSQ